LKNINAIRNIFCIFAAKITPIMRQKIIVFCTLIAIASTLHAQSHDALLDSIDYLIEHKYELRAEKIESISELHHTLTHLQNKDEEQRLYVYDQIYRKYAHFQTDSAMRYLNLLESAESIKDDKDRLTKVLLDKAENLAVMGAYSDAVNILHGMQTKEMIPENRALYYHVCRTVYGWMSDYLRPMNDTAEELAAKTALYRDSIIITDPDEIRQAVVKADRLLSIAQCDSSLAVLNIYKERAQDQQLSYIYYTFAEVYRVKGNTPQQLHYLALTAIQDLKNGLTEYTALPTLAKLLFDQGDVERAYRYLFCSLEDATFCNARLRSVEASEIFPIIEREYTKLEQSKNKRERIIIIGISIITLILGCGIFYLRRQMKKLSMTRQQLADANSRLEEANNQLEEANNQLEEANNQLEDANRMLEDSNRQLGDSNTDLQQANVSLKQMDKVKEEYIAIYLSRCREYLEGLENYRRSLLKLAKTNQQAELMKKLKSDELIETEQQRFYDDFDEAFLNLHPNFVENFNELLRPEERIITKKKDRLTTELRIFALIRLGVDDTAQIAHFLSYSMPTIYNYRSRIKSRSIYDKDEFDRRLMLL